MDFEPSDFARSVGHVIAFVVGGVGTIVKIFSKMLLSVASVIYTPFLWVLQAASAVVRFIFGIVVLPFVWWWAVVTWFWDALTPCHADFEILANLFVPWIITSILLGWLIWSLNDRILDWIHYNFPFLQPDDYVDPTTPQRHQRQQARHKHSQDRQLRRTTKGADSLAGSSADTDIDMPQAKGKGKAKQLTYQPLPSARPKSASPIHRRHQTPHHQQRHLHKKQQQAAWKRHADEELSSSSASDLDTGNTPATSSGPAATGSNKARNRRTAGLTAKTAAGGGGSRRALGAITSRIELLAEAAWAAAGAELGVGAGGGVDVDDTIHEEEDESG
ncbi:hypothetical protein VTI74DRAFT_8032 [Chaetomium olivicolor]